MTPDLLRQCGVALYGERWQTALAADLQVTDRTMRRWLAGQFSIPAGVVEQVRALLVERQTRLTAVLKLLKEA